MINLTKGNTMKKIEQVRLIHSAFKHRRDQEGDANHIATYVPANPFDHVDQVLEDVYRRTQNIDESWINDKSNFTVIPSVDTRSTSVDDLMVVCYANKDGVGYNEVFYRVDDVGFEQLKQ